VTDKKCAKDKRQISLEIE